MTASQILALSHANLFHSISVLWLTALRAAAAWLLVGPVGIIVLYLILVPMIRRLARLHLPDTHPGEDFNVS
jgi:NADH:ubiquinone oxidoreductase subunit 6 (subunit J)